MPQTWSALLDSNHLTDAGEARILELGIPILQEQKNSNPKYIKVHHTNNIVQI